MGLGKTNWTIHWKDRTRICWKWNVHYSFAFVIEVLHVCSCWCVVPSPVKTDQGLQQIPQPWKSTMLSKTLVSPAIASFQTNTKKRQNTGHRYHSTTTIFADVHADKHQIGSVLLFFGGNIVIGINVKKIKWGGYCICQNMISRSLLFKFSNKATIELIRW